MYRVNAPMLITHYSKRQEIGKYTSICDSAYGNPKFNAFFDLTREKERRKGKMWKKEKQTNEERDAQKEAERERKGGVRGDKSSFYDDYSTSRLHSRVLHRKWFRAQLNHRKLNPLSTVAATKRTAGFPPLLLRRCALILLIHPGVLALLRLLPLRLHTLLLPLERFSIQAEPNLLVSG